VFRLDEEVLAWCRDVHNHGGDRQERVDELADHLYCEIRSWTAQGFSEKEAFQRATNQVGDSQELIREHFHSWGFRSQASVILWALLTCNVKTLNRTLTARSKAWMVIGVSIFFAVAMTAVDKVFHTSETTTNVFLAIWWVPFSVLCLVKPADTDEPTRA
tara:strand:- start:25734 stop:26213 length:480 start_codon:yes stop_codon:yes gene_type:complete